MVTRFAGTDLYAAAAPRCFIVHTKQEAGSEPPHDSKHH